jgi:hypothetical protein
LVRSLIPRNDDTICLPEIVARRYRGRQNGKATSAFTLWPHITKTGHHPLLRPLPIDVGCSDLHKNDHMHLGLLDCNRDIQRRWPGCYSSGQKYHWSYWSRMLLLGNHDNSRYELLLGILIYADSDDFQDHGKELHGLKAIAVLMIGAIFATTVSLFFKSLVPK